MNNIKIILRATFVLSCVFIMLSQTVYGYIDPGTGSMIIQIIAGLVLTCGASVGIFWHKIKNFFKRTNNKSNDTGDK